MVKQQQKNTAKQQLKDTMEVGDSFAFLFIHISSPLFIVKLTTRAYMELI